MNDRIAQMAREAGFPSMAVDNLSDTDRARLTAFARLVAEDCAKVCESQAETYKHRKEKPNDQRDIEQKTADVAIISCGINASAIRDRYSKE